MKTSRCTHKKMANHPGDACIATTFPKHHNYTAGKTNMGNVFDALIVDASVCSLSYN